MIIKNIIERNVIEINNNRITKVGCYAFCNCSNLTKINLPAVASIENNAFYYCSKLTSVNLPEVINIGSHAFDNCSSLTSINLPAATNIGEYAFVGCFSLTSVSLPAATSIGYNAFNDCSSLTTINLPAAIRIGTGTFSNCYNLTSVNLPVATTIEYDTFSNCYNLTSISLPAAISIGEYAFYNCSSLTSVNLPAAISIGSSAFSNCYNLTSVDLPVATSIGEYAFNCCSKLMNMRINSDSLCMGNYNMFYSTPIDKTYSINEEYGKILVYPPLVEQYKIASYWSDYADRIFPLGTLIIFTGATENNKYYQNGKEKTEIYGYELTQFDIYNKVWGKLSITIDNVELSDTPLEYNIVAPIDYKTITVKNTSNQSFNSYTINYDDVSFTCTAFPDTVGVPLNTKIRINASNGSYKVKIVDLEITSDTTIDFANYLKEVTYANVSITADNAAQYTTLVDKSNFEVSSRKIQSGNKSHNVDYGFSLGYIKIDTPPFESELSITYSISSEDGYDYGIVLLSTTEQSLTNNIRSSTPSGCTQLIKVSGTVSSTTYTTTLAADTHYYVYFAYAKDSSSDSDSDRFFIENISFTQVE